MDHDRAYTCCLALRMPSFTTIFTDLVSQLWGDVVWQDNSCWTEFSTPRRCKHRFAKDVGRIWALQDHAAQSKLLAELLGALTQPAVSCLCNGTKMHEAFLDRPGRRASDFSSEAWRHLVPVPTHKHGAGSNASELLWSNRREIVCDFHLFNLSHAKMLCLNQRLSYEVAVAGVT